MNETLISLETAKLAKEKGFDRIKIVSKNNIEAAYNAPTQSLLQKWIRENFEIEIIIEGHQNMDHCTYYYAYLHDPNKECRSIYSSKKYKKTQLDCEEDEYEKALEVGLYEALQLIK